MTTSTSITVAATVAASPEKVWEYYNGPTHITAWNSASEDWHTPSSNNDLRVGGRFTHRMEARDGSQGFDFSGTYDEVKDLERIAYTMDDGRKAIVDFKDLGGKTEVTVVFDAENEYPVDFQREGWQSILNEFKKYTEAK